MSGGTERVASIIASELAQRGHDVFLASVQGGEKPFFPLNKRVLVRSLFGSVGRNLFRAPLIVTRIRRLLVAEKVEALIVVESMLTLYTIPAVAGLNIKHICWEHFNFKIDLGRKGRRVARLLAARFCDVVVTLTDRDKDFWLAGTTPKAEVCTIQNPSPFPVQYQHSPPLESRIVLGVGRLVPQKGFDLLLASWQAVNKQAPEWRLLIVGNGPDKQALASLARSLEIESSVEFVDATSDISMHYREAAIYCLSSRFEGFGMVLVEALSFGIPIVSFDCEVGPAEILEGTGSLLVQAGDVTGLSEALLKLIRNQEARQRISELSQKRAEMFQPVNIVEKWVRLLE